MTKPFSEIITGAHPVGFSGWFGMLSIRDGWDHYLLVLALLYMLWTCISILWEEYAPNFYSKQNDSDDKQSPSEPDNASRGNLSELGSCNDNLGLLGGNQKAYGASGFLFRNAKNLLAMPLNLCVKLFRCHAKQPNAPDQRPRATDARHATETQSRGSLHPICSVS